MVGSQRIVVERWIAASSLALVLGVIVFGCSDTAPAAQPADAGVDAGADAAFPILPYPPGPYGGGIGDIMPDIRMHGFAMSKTARDPRALPYRDITLAEVRSDPACTCVVVIKNASSGGCGYCGLEVRTLIELMEKNPSVCGMELLEVSLNFTDVNDAAPATRGDLEEHTLVLRETFPAGLPTTAARFAVTSAVSSWPGAFILRKSDMRILGFFVGSKERFDKAVERYCELGPFNPVETIATGLHARRLAVDETHVWVSDRDLGVVRYPKSGGAPLAIATNADRLALAPNDVVWASSEDVAPFEISRAPKTGGSPTVLHSNAQPITGLAVDGSAAYFTRADGVVGSVPVMGGAMTTMATGETKPSNIVVDGTAVYFIANDVEIVRIPKAGGARTVLAMPEKAGERFQELALGGLNLYALSTGATRKQAIVRIETTTGNPFPLGRAGFVTTIASLEQPQLGGPALVGTARSPSGDGVIVNIGPQGLLYPIPGQVGLTRVVADGAIFFWIAEDGATLRRGRDVTRQEMPF